MNTKIQFGHSIKKEFTVHEDYLSVINGSYGNVPKVVLEEKRKLEDLNNQNPEYFYEKVVPRKLVEIQKRVAKIVNSDPDDIVFVTNATEGMNCCLKNLNLVKGDKIITTNIQYLNVSNVLKTYQEDIGIEIIQVKVTLDMMNDNELFALKFDEELKKHKDLKAAIIYHISASPAILYPIELLTKACKQMNIKVIIDGAHAFGQVDIDLKKIDPDFYMTNLHKWGYVPRPCGILYVNKQYQSTFQPSIVSQYKAEFQKRFYSKGTLDYTALLATGVAIDFREKIGESSIREYQHNLAWEAGQKVEQIWGTKMFVNKKELIPALINVRIPSLDYSNPNDVKTLAKVLERLKAEKNIFMFGHQFDNLGFFTRFGTSIFNEVDDFAKVAQEFLAILKEETKKK